MFKRVLIIEDNRDLADSLGWLLQLLGHETRGASQSSRCAARASSHVALQRTATPRNCNGTDTRRRHMRDDTVLVIDDEPQIRRVVSNALQSEVTRVLEAATGNQGIGVDSAGHPRLNAHPCP